MPSSAAAVAATTCCCFCESLALALYPQFALKRGEHAVAGSLAAAKLSQKQQQALAQTPALKDGTP